MISEDMSSFRGRFGYVGGLVNWSAVFVEAIFKLSFSFSYILFVTAIALSRVNKVFRVAGNVVSNGSCFACEVECVRSIKVRWICRCT